MLSTTYLRLLPTLTLHSADVAKLLLSSQNATQFYLQYFSDREVVLNDHSIEISTNDQTTTFVVGNPDRSAACLALFITSLRLSIEIPDLQDFYFLLGRAQRLTSFFANQGHRYAGLRNAKNFLTSASCPQLKIVAGPRRLFSSAQYSKMININCFDTAIYTSESNLSQGSTQTFARSVSQPAFHAKKMIWNFDEVTAVSLAPALTRMMCIDKPREDVEELTIKLNFFKNYNIKPMTEAILKEFPNLKRLDCYFVLPYCGLYDKHPDGDFFGCGVDAILCCTGFMNFSIEKLLEIPTPNTVINIYCHVKSTFIDFWKDSLGNAASQINREKNCTLEKIDEPRKQGSEYQVTRFTYANVRKKFAENKSFDLLVQGKLVRRDGFLRD